jgi:hypothetical protein
MTDDTQPERMLSASVAGLSANLPKRLMLIIALFQGLFLLVLYRIEKADLWLNTMPAITFPLWSIALLLPLMLLLSLNKANVRATFVTCSGYVSVVALLLIYVGSQASPVDTFPIGSLIATTVMTLFIASFKALMYCQRFASGLPRQYSTLFVLSWRNLLVPALAGAFTLLCAGILFLWAALFNTIGVDFFSYLFGRDWFLFPVLAAAFGVGVIVFRELDHVLDVITRLVQESISLVLPLLVLISIGYVISLLVVGTDLLWKTGWGTAQMLWLTALTLFFVNAVYQDGRVPPKYTSPIHYIVAAGVCVLVVPAALSGYGLYLRLDQYGLTVDRAYAMIVWLLLSLFVLGYVVIIVRRRSEWIAELGKVNQAMSIVIIAVLLITLSPVLDLRKMSLSSQLGRLEDGTTLPARFDVNYVRENLASPGYEALAQLKETATDRTLLANLELDHRYPDTPATADARRAKIERLTDEQVPDALEEMLGSPNFVIGQRTILTSADLDRNGSPEFVLLNFFGGHGIMARYFIERDGEWRSGSLNMEYNPRIDPINNEQLIGDADTTVVAPELNDVIVGKLRFRPGPDQAISTSEIQP